MLPGRALSRLYIANANRHDTGNYTCMLGNEITETVVVHVLNGKLRNSFKNQETFRLAELHVKIYQAVYLADKSIEQCCHIS